MSHKDSQDSRWGDAPDDITALLESARSAPGPDAATRTRLWERIDASVAAGGGPSGDGGATAARAAARQSGAMPVAGGFGWAWGLAAVVLGSVGLGAWLLAGDPGTTAEKPEIVVEAENAAAAPPPAVAVAAQVAAEPPPAAPAAEPEPATDPEPAAVAAPVAPTPPPAAAEQPKQEQAQAQTARGGRRPMRPEDALRAEVMMLGRARQALDRGDPTSALRALKAHARRFRDGQLGEERMALEVLVHARSGDAEQAHRLGRQFLLAHARSVHAGSVRDALANLPR